jgi:hypothetical protein
MRKPVWIGAGLGVLVLALLGVGAWMNRASPDAGVPAMGQAVRSPGAGLPAGGTPAPALVADSASQARSSQESQERRRRLAEVRAEFNALRSQGLQASPEKMRAVVDELEALSPPGFDPRYFQTLRNLLDTSAQIQKLNNELQAISKSTSPKDTARQQAILAEMRVLGERSSAQARALQSYVPVPPAGVKKP